VFLDPDPDPEVSWAERRRLFELPRSSWASYDTSLISEGGGVFPRSAKSVPITPQVRQVLGIADGVAALSPAELISACLCAPVDLLWNGGIGTYVKATAESNAQAGDKGNDALRVNGAQVRARCIGEGGNLGLTQLGRIEYATCGGRINTDFVDNSAGVDTSDYEVNIKILLSGQVRAGRLDEDERDELLASMTDEVAEHVLAHNDDQNLAISNALYQAASMAGVHEDWMERLADRGLLDRELEFLPDTDAMEARRAERRGLTAPELCVLLAYTKIVLANEVLRTDLPDEEDLADRLIGYFPTALRDRYVEQIRQHRLSREIVTTVVVNDFVNRAGISCFHRLSSETGAGAADVLRAHVAARSIFGADGLEAAIRELDHRVEAGMQTKLRLEVRTLVERATRWLVNNRRRPIDISAAVEQLRGGVTEIQAALPDLLPGREQEAYGRRLKGYATAGVPAELAAAVAVLPAAYAALTIVQTAAQQQADVRQVAEVHFVLGQRLGLDRLLGRIIELPREDRWQTMARAALRDDLHTVHALLTAEVLAAAPKAQAGGAARDRVSAWEKATSAVPDSVRTLRSICDGKPDLARVSVGLRIVRALLGQTG
jgi:glutamate dehydrogenase